KGTGLGLSTVFGIVRQSGGMIWVYSEPGIGTSFKVYFPVAQGEAQVGAAASAGQAAQRGSETVLLVEDETHLRTLAKTILTRAGYRVIEAADGERALEQCAQFAGDIHLVITDVIMPRMSGRELVEKLAVLRPRTKTLLMSGYTDDTVVRHGVDRG